MFSILPCNNPDRFSTISSTDVARWRADLSISRMQFGSRTCIAIVVSRLVGLLSLVMLRDPIEVILSNLMHIFFPGFQLKSIFFCYLNTILRATSSAQLPWLVVLTFSFCGLGIPSFNGEWRFAATAPRCTGLEYGEGDLLSIPLICEVLLSRCHFNESSTNFDVR